jgi:inosine-uridine nucleoside N-ribohydrolase
VIKMTTMTKPTAAPATLTLAALILAAPLLFAAQPAIAGGAATSASAAAAAATSSATSAAPKRKVIIDQDAFGPAGSNLQAILMLLQAPDVELLGITITSGDGWRDEEVSHTLRLLEIAGRPEVPVFAGAVNPLINSQARTEKWEQLYGKLFYKGAWTRVWPNQGELTRAPFHEPGVIPKSPAGMPHIKAATESATSFLVRTVRANPGQVSIIAAGPLTNIALAVKLDPDFSTNAKELVFMGGSFNPVAAKNAFAAEYANAPRREFNMRWDPEAASIVLHEPWKQIMQVPVDPTTYTFFKKEFFDRIAGGGAPFAAYLKRFGQSYPMWDELAVAVWLDPTLVHWHEKLLVDADTSFTASYGNTLSWSLNEGPGLGEKPINVVFDVDVPRFEQMTLDLLSKPAAKR